MLELKCLILDIFIFTSMKIVCRIRREKQVKIRRMKIPSQCRDIMSMSNINYKNFINVATSHLKEK